MKSRSFNDVVLNRELRSILELGGVSYGQRIVGNLWFSGGLIGHGNLAV